MRVATLVDRAFELVIAALFVALLGSWLWNILAPRTPLPRIDPAPLFGVLLVAAIVAYLAKQLRIAYWR